MNIYKQFCAALLMLAVVSYFGPPAAAQGSFFNSLDKAANKLSKSLKLKNKHANRAPSSRRQKRSTKTRDENIELQKALNAKGFRKGKS